MTAERWELVRRLLYEGLERPREERSPFPLAENLAGVERPRLGP